MLALLANNPPCLLFEQLFLERMPEDIRAQLVDAKMEDHGNWPEELALCGQSRTGELVPHTKRFQTTLMWSWTECSRAWNWHHTLQSWGALLVLVGVLRGKRYISLHITALTLIYAPSNPLDPTPQRIALRLKRRLVLYLSTLWRAALAE